MKLIEWQKQNKVTNTELAKRLGIHLSFITHLNKGRRKFSPELALKIEQATKGEVKRLELLYPSLENEPKEPDKQTSSYPDGESI